MLTTCHEQRRTKETMVYDSNRGGGVFGENEIVVFLALHRYLLYSYVNSDVTRLIRLLMNSGSVECTS